MCDCKNKIEDNLLNLFKTQKPEASNHSANLMGYTLIIGNQLRQVGYMEAEQTARFPLKNGGEKQRKTKINVIFTYCPFCGTKYEPSRVRTAHLLQNIKQEQEHGRKNI